MHSCHFKLSMPFRSRDMINIPSSQIYRFKAKLLFSSKKEQWLSWYTCLIHHCEQLFLWHLMSMTYTFCTIRLLIFSTFTPKIWKIAKTRCRKCRNCWVCGKYLVCGQCWFSSLCCKFSCATALTTNLTTWFQLPVLARQGAEKRKLTICAPWWYAGHRSLSNSQICACTTRS